MDDLDIRDIMLEATAEIQEIVREVMDELTEPHELEKVRQMWAAAPDEIKEQFMNEQPDDYRSLMESLNERRK